MQDELTVRGIVLTVTQLGEYDKRLVVLTEQLGKITVFANGARRKNSRFAAVTQSFTMGSFTVRPGKNTYTLCEAVLERSFLDLTMDVEQYASASYCCELMDYFTREGVGGKDELNLLYMAFMALLSGTPGAKAVRAAFAIKLLDIEGEMPRETEAAAVQYVLSCPISKTFLFRAGEDSVKQLEQSAKKELKRVMDYPLRSEAILQSLEELKP